MSQSDDPEKGTEEGSSDNKTDEVRREHTVKLILDIAYYYYSIFEWF